VQLGGCPAGTDAGARVSRRLASSRTLVPSGGPWEDLAGYSRAVADGDVCEVAGTTDAGPDGASRHPGDAGAQARAAFEIVEDALRTAGFSLDDVTRTRLYLVDRADVDAVLAVHGELFRDVRPAATLVLVAGLIHPSLRVEVEATARRA
jgi:enamine deaminase RidA (YjgF/YER057c/UK114 family)